ncbi:maleylpyruvate isomerase N-terminal domain-containing protein [Pinibacter soli]|uniref:Maleylpyruvate isomerase N-terminal domain-containing protein n=1 Tax=Pinibacter soli TaxID=3044211 RepID=A0ABT6REG0_9BACT|nr:maleylpyruvate isomerase N-terminal domain-containing protein [Pinibacter soli]MDI3320966.1 maleylpyruvate isomerase N-terminal domain-containing protein [Pinibacter soli]
MIDHTKISKAEWLSLGRSFYSHLFTELNKLSEAEWRSSTRYLGWDCKDLVNHMTSAITINFNLLVKMALEEKPVPEPGFNLFLRNAEEVDRRRRKTTEETIFEFKTEITRLLDRLEELSEEQWKMPAFFFIGDVDICTLFLVQFADNVVHERDLLFANNRWNSFDPKFTAPLMDWFMRMFRPASFRPERTNGESALVQYSITGTAGGNWFQSIKDNACVVSQGTVQNPEITITTTVEDLISTALARPAPFIGKLSRALEWMVKKEKKEDFAAKFTGIIAAMSAIMFGKIKIEGNKHKANAIAKKWFWHFWERTEQTQENILKSRYRK